MLTYMGLPSLYLFVTSLLLLFVSPNSSDVSVGNTHGGRCTGKANCTACSSCNYCKHCNSGGSCGVCGGGSSSTTTSYSRSTSRVHSSSSSGSTVQRSYYVTADQVNVRSGPGTKYSVIGRVSRGELVTSASNASSGWIKITFMAVVGEYVQYKTGFVSAEFLSNAN